MADIAAPPEGVPPAGFVRPARLIDAADFAAVQHRAWLAASAELGLPQPPALAHIERGWERAITAPPSNRHSTWVAYTPAPVPDADMPRAGMPPADSRADRIVGAAAIAPASDPDVDPETTVELVLLAVEPTARRRGHGSRLVTAAMDFASSGGAEEAVAWIASADDAMRRLLEESGWIADGAFRTLESTDAADGDQVRQVRLSTSLGTDSLATD
jgi:GNAT superfamily N-acetyltransferase